MMGVIEGRRWQQVRHRLAYELGGRDTRLIFLKGRQQEPKRDTQERAQWCTHRQVGQSNEGTVSPAKN